MWINSWKPHYGYLSNWFLNVFRKRYKYCAQMHIQDLTCTCALQSVGGKEQAGEVEGCPFLLRPKSSHCFYSRPHPQNLVFWSQQVISKAGKQSLAMWGHAHKIDSERQRTLKNNQKSLLHSISLLFYFLSHCLNFNLKKLSIMQFNTCKN